MQLFLLVALCVAPAAPRASADDAANEWDRLVGTWKLVENAGKAEYPWDYINKNGWVVIGREKATLVIREGRKEMTLAEFGVKIDPSKSPKLITLTIESIAPEGAKAQEKGTKLVGLYALDGDKLKLMVGSEKSPPKAFPAKGDDGVATLRREKAK